MLQYRVIKWSLMCSKQWICKMLSDLSRVSYINNTGVITGK